MRVLVLRTWMTNIGNGLIDKGAIELVERALPEAEISDISGYSGRAAYHMASGEFDALFTAIGSYGETLKSKVQRRSDIGSRMASITDFVDIDIAVLPGCVLYEIGLEPYRQTLQELSERGVDIVFLGAGGGNYSEGTQAYVRETLSDVRTKALITRDSRAYDCYADMFEHAHDGIDCAFFVPDRYDPPGATEPLTALTFDKTDEPSGLAERPGSVVRPDHNPFGYSHPFAGATRRLSTKFFSDYEYSSDNVFISDQIEDYLFWYRNADTTHADRIHACVPALAYGNKARFHYETPRAALFDSVGVGEIRDRVTTLDLDRLEELKRTQVQRVKEIVSETVTTS